MPGSVQVLGDGLTCEAYLTAVLVLITGGPNV